MDVVQFRDSRQSELNEFKHQYSFLRSEYSSVLISAIKETDPGKQQELIQQLLQINSRMADELRTIISKLNQGKNGFDPKELDALTQDLIQYQKDYKEIEQSKDKANTLKKIKESTAKKLDSAMTMYYVYFAILIALCFFAGYLAIKTEWGRRAMSTVQTVLPR